MSVLDAIVSRTPVDGGWSGDRKYKALTADGTAYFLRISPMHKYENLRLQFSHMEKAQALGVRLCGPVELGVCDEGVYTLLQWVEGRDAEGVLPTLDEKSQYAYGQEAGRMLKAMHTLPAPIEVEPWAVRYQRKLDAKIAAYRACPVQYEKGGLYLDLLERERHLVKDRPQMWLHGDYHCGNQMFNEQMELVVIDFDREDAGDPWYEFNRIIWDVRVGAEFARGLLDGYFGGDVPEEFWRVMRLYLCQNMLSSLPWAAGFGDEEIRIARENAERVLGWYDDLREIVPNWYRSK
jgi:aminoglycoside phosphotransferase (APT) family kinase protein